MCVKKSPNAGLPIGASTTSASNNDRATALAPAAVTAITVTAPAEGFFLEGDTEPKITDHSFVCNFLFNEDTSSALPDKAIPDTDTVKSLRSVEPNNPFKVTSHKLIRFAAVFFIVFFSYLMHRWRFTKLRRRTTPVRSTPTSTTPTQKGW